MIQASHSKSLVDYIEFESEPERKFAEALDLKDRSHFQINYLKPAIKAGLIEMTLPDKQKSKIYEYKTGRFPNRSYSRYCRDS